MASVGVVSHESGFDVPGSVHNKAVRLQSPTSLALGIVMMIMMMMVITMWSLRAIVACSVRLAAQKALKPAADGRYYT